MEAIGNETVSELWTRYKAARAKVALARGSGDAEEVVVERMLEAVGLTERICVALEGGEAEPTWTEDERAGFLAWDPIAILERDRETAKVAEPAQIAAARADFDWARECEAARKHFDSLTDAESAPPAEPHPLAAQSGLVTFGLQASRDALLAEAERLELQAAKLDAESPSDDLLRQARDARVAVAAFRAAAKFLDAKRRGMVS